jgi:hypothetical protein
MFVSSLIFIFLSSTRFILNSPSFEFGGVVAEPTGLAGLSGLTGLAELDVFF